MKIGLLDCDRKTQSKVFPNLSLMKISAYHRSIGDQVGWYDGSHFDRVYVSKVFSFSPDPDDLNTSEVVKGGSGFAIRMVNGSEVYDRYMDLPLPSVVDNMFPDYSIYGITDTAYGFLSKGCPRGCSFCHVQNMQGSVSRKVNDLSAFWNGQKK